MPQESGRRLCHSHGSEALCSGHYGVLMSAIYNPIKASLIHHTFTQSVHGFLHICNNTDMKGGSVLRGQEIRKGTKNVEKET